MRAALSIVEPVTVDYLLREVRTAGLLVSAGFPSPAGDDLEDPIDLVAWIVRRETSTFWYRVSGNSLSRAGILDGDFVAIDRAGKVQPGRTVLALHNGDMLLKVLTRRDGRLWLEARSDDHYPPLPVLETTEIWGVVAGIARRYPVE
ncbi:S24 family peptidase [Rhizobium sp. RU36D]|uniref:LexA family protein n=1 Tax=Rhizobium sp. RU36D TaxID=1907415 RepID=UPI0009D8337A|nr:S24 family peptidase [Rhizobium sp. RU36D]SMD16304.1 SOS response UmuD protein. Serine peptidase. MEROPS family S24 [Rhizobium sp. RU36D]